MPKVSIIIPTTTGGLGFMARLIPVIVNEKDIEIIIIDNYSRDGTVNYLSQHNVTIKVNNPGRNFSQSNNQGAIIAQGDHFLFLNNDTVPDEGFVQEMLKTFSIDPDIGIVGCLLFTMTNPKKVQHAGTMFTKDYVPYELGLEIPSIAPGILTNDPRVRSVREVPSVTAACMMVKREAFEKVGGFDEEYINGWEDTDLVLKIKEQGYKSWYTGETSVFHHHFGSKTAGRFRFESENRKRYDTIWVNTGRAKKVLGKFRTA